MTESEPRLGILRNLVEVAQAQIAAARELRAGDLGKLNERHIDLLFQLEVAMNDPLPESPALLDALREEAHRLEALDRRLEAIARSVVQVLDRAAPTGAAPTYGPSGRLHGG